MRNLFLPPMGFTREQLDIMRRSNRWYDDDGMTTGSLAAGVYGSAGMKCEAQFGMVILGLMIENPEAAVYNFQEYIGNATAALLTGYTLASSSCRLRNKGSGGQGQVQRGLAKSFKAATADFSVMQPREVSVGGAYVPATTTTEFERCILLERFDHYWIRHQTLQKGFSAYFYGLEFLSQEERDLWDAVLL